MADQTLAPPLPRHANDMATGPSLSVSDYLKATLNECPAPRPVGAHNSESISRLHEKCQSLALENPNFIFASIPGGGWGAKVTWLGEVAEANGPYSTKQQAKAVLSAELLKILQAKEGTGEVKRLEKHGMPNGEAGAVTRANANGGITDEGEQFENYIGQLLEFQRSTDSPQPSYSEFQLGTSYFSTLVLESPHLPVSPRTFGSQTMLFRSKKLARQYVAKEAISCLKDLCVWKEASSSTKGIKRNRDSLLRIDSENIEGDDTAGTTHDTTPGNGPSYAARVQSLAVQMGLESPSWQYTSAPAAPGMLSVACYFKNGGQHAGPIGEVHHILGKKKARDACARNVFHYLTLVKEQRLASAFQMISGRGATDQNREQRIHGTSPGENSINIDSALENANTTSDDSMDEFYDGIEDHECTDGDDVRKGDI